MSELTTPTLPAQRTAIDAAALRAYAEANPDKDVTHVWIGAAEIVLTDKIAKHANLRLSFRAEDQQRIDVLEVYCRGCRRPYDDVADLPCAAKIDNTHLIGGNPGERKKRKIAPRDPDAIIERGPSFTRQGIDAVLHGGAL